jgi:uncharacterized protein involved in response to NO
MLPTRARVPGGCKMLSDLVDAPVRARFTVLCYGFRPFFLLAGLAAIMTMAVLWWSLATGDWAAGSGTPFAWHGHEMLFGFVAAAIAGFLLTAVPSWTGTKAVAGWPLAGLVLIWAAGRVAWAPLPFTPPAIVPAAGLGFFPVLALLVATPLVRSRNYRNLPFLLFLALLFAADWALYARRFEWSAVPPVDGVRLAINGVMLLVVIVGGRIVPAFTRNAMRQMNRACAITPAPRLDAACIAAALAVLLIDLAAPHGAWSGAVAGVTAVLLAARLIRWQGWRVLDVPLLWVLHAGYAWLALALALKAAWLLAGAPWAVNWMHALTAGAFGTMILGVTTRATLGHTARPLEASRLTTAAYVLVTLAAVLRVFGPPLVPALFLPVLWASMLLWITAFALFIVVYGPMLVRPRADGKPG